MLSSMKPIVTGGALLVAIAITACAQTPGAVQIAALPASDATSADRAVTLPDVALPDLSITAPANRAPTPVPRSWYYDPYISGLSQHAGPNSRIKVTRAPKPTPMSWYYDPYAGGATTCPSGTTPGGVLKCKDIIPLSHPVP